MLYHMFSVQLRIVIVQFRVDRVGYLLILWFETSLLFVSCDFDTKNNTKPDSAYVCI